MTKILIVDDKQENLYLLKSLLEPEGFKTISAKNGAEALGLIKSDPPDLIISDILMPVMDGFTLCMECKKDKALKVIPFFIFTATYTDNKDKEYALSLGADRFILKPQEPDDFLKIIRDFLKDVKKKKIHPKRMELPSETVLLKEYNEVLIRKIEDKMLQTEKAEKALRKYAEDLKNEIDECKKYEESLEKSEEYNRLLFTTSPIGLALCRMDGSFVDVNPAFSDIIGRTVEDTLKLNFRDITPEKYAALDDDQLKALEKNGYYGKFEKEYLHKDGHLVPVLLQGIILERDDERFIWSSVENITERKKAEESIRKNEVRLRSYFESVTAGLAITSSQAEWIEVNDRLCEMLGYKRDELLKNTWTGLTYPADLEIDIKNFNQVLEGKIDAYSLDKRFIRKDGSLVWINLSVRCVRCSDGSVDYFVAILFDISKRKKAESALMESERRLSSIYQAVGDMIFHLAVEAEDRYRFLSVNQAFLNVTGLSKEMIVGKLVNEVIPEPSLSFVLAKYRQAIKENSIMRWEEISEYPTGQLTGDVSIAPIVDEKGICTHLVGSVHDITKRKKMEEALVESEKKYRQLVTQSPDGIFVVDLSGKFISANRAICESLNYTEEELMSIKINDIVPEKYHSLHKQRLMAILKGEGTNTYAEYEVIGKDRITHFVEIISVPYYKGKEIIGFQGIARDITERKAAEEKLRSSEERLKILFEYAPDAYYLNDLKGNFIDGNIAAEKLLGISRHELIGKSFLKLNLLPINQLPKAAELLIKNSFGKPTGPDEFVLNRNDGSKVTIEIITHPIKIKNQTLVLGLARDITERRKAEEALKESEEKYRRIFENVQDMFFEASIDGIILEVSPSFELISKGQYKRDDVIGKSIYDFSDDPEESVALMNALMKNGFVSDSEINLKNRDGSIIPCSISSKIIFGAGNHPEKIIGSMHDITDRKNASDALKFAKERAEASDKLKTTFLNNISHEVRTPLNGILGFVEIMSNTDLPEEEKKITYSMLYESSDRLLDTITNYMDISLITSANIAVNKKDFKPVQIMKELSVKYIKICSGRKLKLALKLPEHYDKLIINSDPEIFSKILNHLLSNAVKFTEEGSIEYGYNVREKELEFYVKDTGIGIGKESFKSIFNNFIKEDRGPSNVSEGSGLGLSISNGLVELLGGKIWVESEKGKGSVFFFTIPFLKESEIHHSVIRTDSINKNKTSRSILVAEDDEINFFYLRTLLIKNTSAEIIHASNGREAIDMFKENPGIGLVLMDIKMPVMDGLDATKQIKAINRNIPVIAITAYAMTGDEARILDAGCDSYLTKPINKKLLLEKIAEFIEV